MRHVRYWIFDADDTLWESALFFEAAEKAFLELLTGLPYSVDTLRREIRRRDLERLSVTGYGPGPYMDTLETVLYDLIPAPAPELLRSMGAIRNDLYRHPVILCPGVEDTLGHLRSRGDGLYLYTMGEKAHQMDKLERSGLSGLFRDHRVTPRKTPEDLGAALTFWNLPPDQACVVGNSPRSDMHPALALGVNAVHVRKTNTWEAESMALPESSLLAVVQEIPEILDLLNLEPS